MRFFIEGVGRHRKRIKSKKLNIGKAQSFLFYFKEMEVKINLSRFHKLAEYKQGKFTMLMPHEHYHAKHYGVYIIVFDKGKSFYVGTSQNLRNRIMSHWNAMSGNYHCLPLVQNAFNNCQSFGVYALIEFGGKAGESDFIRVLRPPLNKSNMGDARIFYDDVKFASVLLGVNLSALLDENRKIIFVDNETDESEEQTFIICPHCGERIKLSVEK